LLENKPAPRNYELAEVDVREWAGHKGPSWGGTQSTGKGGKCGSTGKRKEERIKAVPPWVKNEKQGEQKVSFCNVAKAPVTKGKENKEIKPHQKSLSGDQWTEFHTTRGGNETPKSDPRDRGGGKKFPEQIKKKQGLI